MSKTYFEILRPGINTTIQDSGRNHLYHIGITISGAMDQRNYKFANNIVNNKLNEAMIEFAHQGPLLKLRNGTINFAITGNVFFNIIRNNSKIEEGNCYQNYILSDGEVRENWYWEASWPDAEGESVCKSFSIKKYGDEIAKHKAIRARNNGVKNIEGVFWASKRGELELDGLSQLFASIKLAIGQVA